MNNTPCFTMSDDRNIPSGWPQNKYPPICLIEWKWKEKAEVRHQWISSFFHYPMKCVILLDLVLVLLISQQIHHRYVQQLYPRHPRWLPIPSVHHCRLNAWSRFDLCRWELLLLYYIHGPSLHFVLASSFVPYRQFVKTEIGTNEYHSIRCFKNTSHQMSFKICVDRQPVSCSGHFW